MRTTFQQSWSYKKFRKNMKKYWWLLLLFLFFGGPFFIPIAVIVVLLFGFMIPVKGGINSMAFTKNLRRAGVEPKAGSTCPRCLSPSIYTVNGKIRCGKCGFKET